MAASGSVAAQELQPLHPGQHRFQAWEGEPAEARPTDEVLVSIEPATEFSSQFLKTEDQSRKEFLSVDAQGNIVLHAVIEYKDKAVSQFRPPLVIAYSDLAAGEERRAESKMRVVDLNNRLKQKESGTAVRTIKYIDDQTIRTTLGEYRAKRIEVHFTADLKLADADERTTLWVVPGIGVVAEESREVVKVLGLAGKTKQRILTLLDSTPIGNSAASQPAPQ